LAKFAMAIWPSGCEMPLVKRAWTTPVSLMSIQRTSSAVLKSSGSGAQPSPRYAGAHRRKKPQSMNRLPRRRLPAPRL
jgi:hypothetical protein